MANYPRGGDKMVQPKPRRPKPPKPKARKSPPPPPKRVKPRAIPTMPDPYTQEITADQSRTRVDSQWAADVYKALSAGLGGAPAQIQGIYRTAAADQSAFGKGYSDALQHLQQAGASDVNKTIATAGGDSSQMLHPGPEAANVLYGLGGAIPANTLTGQGAAFASAAAFLPGAAAAQGKNLIAKMLSESQARQSDLSLKGALYRDQQKAARAAAQQKLAYQREQMRYKWASLDATNKRALLSDRRAAERLYLEQKRVGLTAQNQSFSQWYKQQTLGLAQSKEARIAGAPTYRNVRGGVVAFDPTTGQSYWAVPPTSRGGGGRKATAGQLKLAGQIAEQAFGGVPEKDAKGRATGNTVFLTYQEAIRKMTSMGVPLAAAQRALAQYWNPNAPGAQIGYVEQRGHTGKKIPYVWFPERTEDRPAEGRPLIPYQQRHPKGGAAAETAAVRQGVLGVVDSALKERGVRYVWGGTTPAGFDCSGLLFWAYGQHGIKIPRTSQTQWRYGKRVHSVVQAQPGDAFFYRPEGGGPGHVAMYVGNGLVVVAPHTGSYVQVVRWDSIGQFMGIRRFV